MIAQPEQPPFRLSQGVTLILTMFSTCTGIKQLPSEVKSPTACTSRQVTARHAQNDHFGIRPETSEWLVRPSDASASPNALSAGSPKSYMRLPPPQSQSRDVARAGVRSACDAGARGNTPASDEWPDAADSGFASD